jgi:hypothetical protein
LSRARQAIDALLSLGNEHPIPLVIDEFPYLAKANSTLLSLSATRAWPLMAKSANIPPFLPPDSVKLGIVCPFW